VLPCVNSKPAYSIIVTRLLLFPTAQLVEALVVGRETDQLVAKSTRHEDVEGTDMPDGRLLRISLIVNAAFVPS
jgi:hypothetical protein